MHVLAQVCRALEEAHGVGLIHRDIKPANILLCERGGTPDLAKVVDFGLVKSVMASGAAGVTLENVAVGTPHYMAPEAISSPDRMDARSDLYAVGAVAYFLLTGKVVFEGPTAIDVFTQHLRSVPVAPSVRLGRPIPAGLENVVLAALAKEPDRRPESARALREALLACADVPAWKEAEAAAWWQRAGTQVEARAGRCGVGRRLPRSTSFARSLTLRAAALPASLARCARRTSLARCARSRSRAANLLPPFGRETICGASGVREGG